MNPSQPTLTSVVRRSPTVLQHELDEDLLLADAGTGNYFGVNTISRRIWELLEQPATVEELCCRLAGEYGADLSEVRQDALEFLSELARYGLLEVQPAARSD